MKTKEDKIRSRTSYEEFQKIYNDLPPNIPKKEKEVILLMIWKIIDNHKGFHYQKHSDWAMESIELLLKDITTGGINGKKKLS